MAITSGTYYVGPNETLVDWSAAFSQIDGQTLSGIVIFLQRGHITTSASAVLTNINLNSYYLRISSEDIHTGSPSSGWKTTFTKTNGVLFSILGGDNTGNFYFNGLNVELTLGALTFLNAFNGPIEVKNIVVKHSSVAAPGKVVVVRNTTLDIFNIKTWSTTSVIQLIVVDSFGLGSSSLRIENCTVWNLNTFSGSSCFDCSNVVTSATTRYIKNCYAFSLAGTGGGFSLGAMTGSYNASNDATATGIGSITGVTLSDFVSTSESSSDFLNLKSTSILISAGIVPSISGNTVGIRGNLRPGDNYYSIGADEYGEANMSFVVDKYSSTIPYYFRITDTSDLSLYTSATDYTRLWSIKNLRTNVTELFQSTSASMNYSISADSLLGDTYTLSLSAVI